MLKRDRFPICFCHFSAPTEGTAATEFYGRNAHALFIIVHVQNKILLVKVYKPTLTYWGRSRLYCRSNGGGAGRVGVAEGLSLRAAAQAKRAKSLREFVSKLSRNQIYPSYLLQSSPLLVRRWGEEFERIYCPHLLDGISVAQEWPRVVLKRNVNSGVCQTPLFF